MKNVTFSIMVAEYHTMMDWGEVWTGRTRVGRDLTNWGL